MACTQQAGGRHSAQTAASKHSPSIPVAVRVGSIKPSLGNSQVLFNQSTYLPEIRLSAVAILKRRDVMEREIKIRR